MSKQKTIKKPQNIVNHFNESTFCPDFHKVIKPVYSEKKSAKNAKEIITKIKVKKTVQFPKQASRPKLNPVANVRKLFSKFPLSGKNYPMLNLNLMKN